MSTPSELPSEPPPLPNVPTVSLATEPPPVIGYASGETPGVASQGTRVALALLAALYFLIAVPSVIGLLVTFIEDLSRSNSVGGEVLLQLAGVAIAGVYITCGLWMILRRRWMWRALHITLAILCALELIATGVGAAIIIAYKHATGWDGIALAIGIFLFVAASVPFLLHAFTKLALLRLNFRRAFTMGDYEPHTLHRAGTIVMISLYVLLMMIGGVWFLLA